MGEPKQERSVGFAEARVRATSSAGATAGPKPCPGLAPRAALPPSVPISLSPGLPREHPSTLMLRSGAAAGACCQL